MLERLKGQSSMEPRSQLQMHNNLVNAAFSVLLAAERPIMRVNKLFGLTVFAGGHKP
jgi:hypothetical protein